MSEPHTADLGTRYRYRLEGAHFERERIIEMLETRNRNKTHSEGRYCGLCEAIDLIKGEQK